MAELKKIIREFMVDNFLFGESNGFEDSTSFLDSGIIDSTGILELVCFIESTFHITVKDEELIPENLDSIARISSYLESKGVLPALP